MSNKPTLGVKSLFIDGFMSNNQPVELRASAWLNVPKDQKFDQQANAMLEQVKSMIIDNRISVYVNLQHRTGEDPKMWPTVSKFPLFPNTPQQQAAQPVTQQPQEANDTNLDDDEIPF